MPSTVDQYKKRSYSSKQLTYPQMRVIAAKCGMLDAQGNAKPLVHPKDLEDKTPTLGKMHKQEL